MDNLDFIRRNLDYLRQSRKDWQLALNAANQIRRRGPIQLLQEAD